MTDSQHSIQQVANLFNYFRSELLAAFDKLGLTTTDATETYLVHLLEGFVRLDEEKAKDIGFERPAALLLGEALNSAGDRRIEAYRRLGDASLFSCGFFEQHLGRRTSVVPVEYYRRMGRNAYHSLQSLMEFKAPGGAFHVIFDELAAKFDTVVEAFRVLATGSDGPTAEFLLERWQQGADLDAARLIDAGFFPSGSGGEA